MLLEKMMNKRHRYEPNKMLLTSFRQPKTVLRVVGTEGDTIKAQGCKITIRQDHLWLGTDDDDFQPFYTNQRLGKRSKNLKLSASKGLCGFTRE